MELLELLASCIEQGRTAIAPTLVGPLERERLDRLQRLGAMTFMPAQVIFCPHCEIRTVRVIAVGSGFCIDCGLVNLTTKDTQRLAPDGDWLRRRMAQALGLAGEFAWTIVPGKVWRLGDVGHGDRRHRILFGQQLGDVMTLRVLQSAWPSYVGEIPTILVTTTPAERIHLPGIPVRLVPLATAFRVRGDGLVADEAVWAGVQTPTTPTIRSRHGPFSQDFGEVLLLGETAPVPLTRTQAAIFRVLWELEGAPIDRDALMQKARIELEKPVDAFPRNKYADANRAYRALVSSDRRGKYWMLRNDVAEAPLR
jgi:hypothetical protein